jgi:bla regulator protein blaR1
VTRLATLAIALTCALCFAQSKKEFDVATVKPTADKDNNFMLRRPQNGTFSATGVTLKMLIMSAYEVNAYQVSGGPSWIGTQRWDIQAKAEGATGLMPRDQFDEVLRALIEDRFRLKTRRESKDMPVYELVVAKNGSKLSPHTGDPAKPQDRVRMGYGSLRFQQARIAGLVFQLSVQLGRTVIDKTGLTGEYDFALAWLPEPGQGGPESIGLPPQALPSPAPSDPNRPSIFTAIQEQLGLRLDSQRGPVDMIVIDSVEKPTEN